tara:strand:- start:314 stop:832 length:519 start_codon:yes stop_codon:yes gene_type:complete
MANAVTKIETLSGSGYTVDFNSIPSTYDDLMVIGSAKTDQTSNGSVAGNSFYFRFNGDSSNDYAYGYWGTSAAGYDEALQTSISSVSLPGCATSQSSNAGWGHFYIHIPGYKQTTSQKSFLYQGGFASASRGAFIAAGNWNKTAAITSMSIGPLYGQYVSGTRMTLYGITNA